MLLSLVLFFMYGGALVWLWAFSMPIELKIIAAIGLLIGLFVHQRQHVLKKGKRAIDSLVWSADDSWQIKAVNGDEINASLLGSSFVHPWLIILNLKPKSGGRTWPVIIMPDAIDSTSFRRLVARLKRGSEVYA